MRPLGSLADAAAALVDAFAGARMRVRDDEDPAVTRCPPARRPGAPTTRSYATLHARTRWR